MANLEIAKKGNSKEPDLLVVGGGSAAFAAALTAGDLGANVTMINDGLPIGGTCVNVGCVPSKTLIRAAEAHHRATHHCFKGIESHSRVADFKAIIEQKRELVEELRQNKYVDILSNRPNVRFLKGRGRLAAKDTVEVGGERIRSSRILIATGASPWIPPVPGLEKTGYLTSDSAYELDELPESILVLGGRYIALENAQMFARLGSRVTILQRSSRILPDEAKNLTDELTRYLTAEGIRIVTDVDVRSVRKDSRETVAEADVGGRSEEFRASHLFVATGRNGNTGELNLQAMGVEVDGREFVKVNDRLETRVPGIYAAGDVIGDAMYVYTAAYEGSLAAENALRDASKPRDYRPLPWVIFTDPQVAGVGLDERQAKEAGIDAEAAQVPLSYVARSLAARDTRGFIKLIRDRATDRLVGARILAPEGSELLMELSLAIKFGLKVPDLVSLFHPYLTLSEGVKIAALAFQKDVKQLSCCAS